VESYNSSNRKGVQTVIHSDNDFATVAFLRITDAVLEAKPEAQVTRLAVPPLLEPEFTLVHDAVLQSEGTIELTQTDRDSDPNHSLNQMTAATTSMRLGSWVSVADIQRDVPDGDTGISFEGEVRECFNILQSTPFVACIFVALNFILEHLNSYSLDLSHIANINIFLSSMDLFVPLNAIYSTYFGSSPPARACVAVDLHPPVRIKLDCIAYAEGTVTERQALHVRGLSYWAPANIGPYSQAVVVGFVCIIQNMHNNAGSRLMNGFGFRARLGLFRAV
jgi:diphthine-ammonia ligase